MKKNTHYLLIILSLTFLLNAGDSPSAFCEREMMESVVAVVNDSVITQTMVEDKCRREMYLIGLIPGFQLSSALKQRMLNEIIEEEVLVQAAREKGIEPSPGILDSFTSQFLKKARYLFPDEETFQQHIDTHYIDFVDFQKRMKRWEEREYLVNALVSLEFSVTDEEIDEYEKDLRQEGRPAVRYELSQIFFRLPEDATTGDVNETERKALEILVKIQEGADFSEMASQYSEDAATAEKGGRIGIMNEGNFSEEIEKHVKLMDEGEVSLPIVTEKGIHLIRLDEKTDARSLLFRRKFSEERRKLTGELRKNVTIRIIDPEFQKVDEDSTDE